MFYKQNYEVNMVMKKILILFTIFSLNLIISINAFSKEEAEEDTLYIFNATNDNIGELSEPWEHILPPKQNSFTSYTIVRSVGGPYLRTISSGTGSWVEIKTDDIDIKNYPMLNWEWKVDKFPKTVWEQDRKEDDFALRIELVYDYKGGRNIINIMRKGIFKSIFQKYPPVLIVSYVWAIGLPIDKNYISPSEKNMTVIAVESDSSSVGRWMKENRNIQKDVEIILGKSSNIRLKKIRIRSDSDNTSSLAESGIRFINISK